MAMNQKGSEVLEDLRAYLEYLKGLGIHDLHFFGDWENNVCSSGIFRDGEPIYELPSSYGTQLPSRPQRSSLEEIRREIGNCRKCKLHRTRQTIVFGEGNPQARLMVIGEGPGYDEDVQGRPFVGKAGQLLTKILQSIGVARNEVYIANIIKCRPPQNRNPEPDEIESCFPFLLKQIEAVQPKIICALGTFSAQTLLRTDAKITALRGKAYHFSNIRIFPTYHPAYLLRNPEKKREVWEDMQRIAKALAESS